MYQRQGVNSTKMCQDIVIKVSQAFLSHQNGADDRANAKFIIFTH